MSTTHRRLKLLKLEGQGHSRAEIIEQLSNQFDVSERAVHYDFETRACWQPILQQLNNPEDLVLQIVNRYLQIYREASLRLRTAVQESTQLGALNIMLKANKKIFESALLPDLLHRLEAIEEKAKLLE